MEKNLVQQSYTLSVNRHECQDSGVKQEIDMSCELSSASLIPEVQEEPVLDQKIENKVDKAFHSHESNIFPQKVPPEGVLCVLFT